MTFPSLELCSLLLKSLSVYIIDILASYLKHLFLTMYSENLPDKMSSDNHVLPPKLPNDFNGDDLALIHDIGQRLHDALVTFRNVKPSSQYFYQLQYRKDGLGGLLVKV